MIYEKNQGRVCGIYTGKEEAYFKVQELMKPRVYYFQVIRVNFVKRKDQLDDIVLILALFLTDDFYFSHAGDFLHIMKMDTSTPSTEFSEFIKELYPKGVPFIIESLQIPWGKVHIDVQQPMSEKEKNVITKWELLEV